MRPRARIKGLPDERLQRSRSLPSLLRSPLTRRLFGSARGMTARVLGGIVLLSLDVVLGCTRTQTAGTAGDWRYASWGMTEEQVVAASNGSAIAASPEDRSADRSLDSEVRLKAPVSWIGQSFVAFFAFNRRSERLSSVTLQLQNGPEANVGNLRDRLTSLYGSPSSSMKRQDAELTVWFVGTEQVSLARLVNPETAIGAPVASVSYQTRSGRS